MRASFFAFVPGISLSFALVACGDPASPTTSTTAASSSSSSGSGGAGAGGAGGSCDKLPAAGFSYASAGVAGKTLGDDVTMTFGAKGEPILAFRDIDDGANSTTWELTRWDPCAGVFTPPVIVAKILTTFGHAPPEKNASLAYDASKDRLVFAYEVIDGVGTGNEDPALDLVTSDDGGATWSTPHHITGGNNPGVAAANGKIYFAYVTTTAKVTFEEGDGTTFTSMTIPDDADAAEGPYAAPITSPVSLVLDSDQKPGLAFTSSGDLTGAYNVRVHYWHAGMASSVSVVDSANTQDDYPTATLAFDGKKPRIITPIPVDGKSTSDLWFSASNDGLTWSAPIGLARDGVDKTSWYQALAVDAGGKLALAAHSTDQVTEGAHGALKIWRGADLTTFSVDAADSMKEHSSFTGTHVQAAYSHGKLMLAFSGPITAGDPAGVVFWREP
jgi:hypothetical protein